MLGSLGKLGGFLRGERRVPRESSCLPTVSDAPECVITDSQVYVIEWYDGVIADVSDRSFKRGDVDCNKLVIRVDRTMPISRQRETLLHEIIHMLCHERNIDLSYGEEHVVSALSGGLLAILRQPSIWRFLFEDSP